MLDTLQDEQIDERVWRATLTVGRYQEVEQIRKDAGDGLELTEAIDFLADPMPVDVPTLQALLMIPFKYPTSSRFSDGSFGILYTAREPETAAAELAHHAPKRFPAAPGRNVTVRFVIISCRVQGTVRDTRAALVANDWLIGDDYAPCRAVGREVLVLGLDGLLAQSARLPDGTNVPVFSEAVASDPAHEADVLISIRHGMPATFELKPRLGV